MLDLRAQYIERFGAMPGVALCAAHDGEFDGDEVARLGAQRTPAIYVACMRVGDIVDESGPTAAQLGWVAMIVARGPDAVREERELAGDVAGLLALRITVELNEGDSFEAATERASKVRARNLFGSAAARRGYRLWAVSWEQATTIRPSDLDPVLSDYLLQHTTYPNLKTGELDAGEPVSSAIDVELTGAP